MKSIDCFLKIFAHLHFVNKDKIPFTCNIMCVYIIV